MVEKTQWQVAGAGSRERELQWDRALGSPCISYSKALPPETALTFANCPHICKLPHQDRGRCSDL